MPQLRRKNEKAEILRDLGNHKELSSLVGPIVWSQFCYHLVVGRQRTYEKQRSQSQSIQSYDRRIPDHATNGVAQCQKTVISMEKISKNI